MLFSRRRAKSKKGKKIVVHSVFYISTILLRWYFLYFEPLNMCQFLTNRRISSENIFSIISSRKIICFSFGFPIESFEVNSKEFPATSIR